MPDEAERERFDSALGSALCRWAAAVVGVSVQVQGPLDASGTDPRWILSLRSADLDADFCLFPGMLVDVSAARPSDPGSDLFVGGEDGLTEARLIEMLEDLAAAARGGPLPDWLRPIGSRSGCG